MIEIPELSELPAQPRRIILHWTGGGVEPNAVDRACYHYIIAQSGTPHLGVPVAKNMRRLTGVRTTEYAPHIAGWNSYSVGVAFAGMMAANQRMFGPAPLKRPQVLIGCYIVGLMCRKWGLEVTPDTVMTHSEADWRHGVKQRGKWDIDVLPWAPTLSREEVADQLRRWVSAGVTMGDIDLAPVRPTPTVWRDTHAWLEETFGRTKS